MKILSYGDYDQTIYKIEISNLLKHTFIEYRPVLLTHDKKPKGFFIPINLSTNDLLHELKKSMIYMDGFLIINGVKNIDEFKWTTPNIEWDELI